MERIRYPIRLKLLFLLLGVSVLTIALFAFLGTQSGRKSLLESVSKHLASVRAGKASHLRGYLQEKVAETQTIAKNPIVTKAFADFEAGMVEANKLLPEKQRGGSIGGWPLPENRAASEILGALRLKQPIPEAFSKYRKTYEANNFVLRSLCHELGFDNMLLVSKRGQVVYTSEVRADFGVNLSQEGVQNSVLAKAVESVTNLPNAGARFQDFGEYLPNPSRISAFVSCPVMDGEQVIGTIVFSLPSDYLARVMNGDKNWYSDGLGETGESYLVGRDFLMRSESRFRNSSDAECSTTSVLCQKVNTDSVRLAFQGEEGVIYDMGYRGREVLSAYTLVNFRGVRWAVISELELDEAYLPITEFQQQIFVSAIVVICLVALLSFIVSRRFVRPIVDLTTATHQHGTGGELEPVPVTTRDEIGDLTETYNRMVENQNHMERTSQSLRRNIVHDLKTPVTVIKGFAETLLQPYHSDDAALRKELLTDIVEQSERLLDDLKDIITPVSDSWEPQPEEFNLSRLVESVVASERYTARAAEHKLMVFGADDPINITADRRKIRRVIENLLSNAVKYSPGEGKTVKVELTHTDDEVTVAFVDEGLGLTLEELQKVLIETGRLSDSALGIEGSGFGIDSCRRVLQAHGGRLEATSEKGVGSMFRIRIPRFFQQTTGEES